MTLTHDLRTIRTSKNFPLYVGAVVAFAVIVVLAIVAAGASAERDNLRRGIDEGFKLQGTYQEFPVSFVFGYEADDAWLRQDQQARTNTEGTFKATADPNVYHLFDADGSEVGWAHLAHSAAGGEGMLYVCLGADEPQAFPKVADTFGFVVMD